MAATPWALFGNALEKILDGTVDLDTDSLRMVLVGSGWTPNQSTNALWSDISANEIANGNGYTTHGKALTQALSRSGLVVTLDCDDQTWSGSTFEVAYAVIVRDADGNGALAAGDIPLFYAELEDGGTLSPSAGDLSITINASGVYTFTAGAAA